MIISTDNAAFTRPLLFIRAISKSLPLASQRKPTIGPFKGVFTPVQVTTQNVYKQRQLSRLELVYLAMFFGRPRT